MPLPKSKQKSFDYFVPFEITGKAGDVKKASARASAGGKLLLFRGYRPIVAGGRDNYDTKVIGMEAGGRHLLPKIFSESSAWGYPENLNDYFGRSNLDLYLHPRQDVTVTVKFLKDAVWRCQIHGKAVEVADEGVYAIEPPEHACARPVPIKFVEPGITPDNYTYLQGGVRCADCWHPYDEHATWSWQKWERTISLADVGGGDREEFTIEASRGLFVEKARLHMTDRSSFLTTGYSTEKTMVDWEPFDVYRSLHVRAGQNVLFPIHNTTSKRVASHVTVSGYEMVAA